MPCIQLSLKARNLKARTYSIAKPNSFAILYEIRWNGEERLIGRTEACENTSNPCWVKVFHLNQKVGKELRVKIELYDYMGKVDEDCIQTELTQEQRQKFRFIGSDRFTVNEMLVHESCTVDKVLSGKKGTLSISMERTKDVQKDMNLILRLRGVGLVTMNWESNLWNRMSSTYFEISRQAHESTGVVWHKVYKSESIKNHIHPVWKQIEIDLRMICNNDFKRPIRIAVYDVRKKKGLQLMKRLMGMFETNIEELLKSKSKRGNADITNAFTLRRDGLELGRIVVIEADIKQAIDEVLTEDGSTEETEESNPANSKNSKATFNDYRYGGCMIDTGIVIDFSSKNGPSSKPGSPHYYDKDIDHNDYDTALMNDYQKAIFSVGSILAKYKTTKKFPVRGLGIFHNNTDLQLFQCGNDEEVDGIPGILDAYAEISQGPFIPSGRAGLSESINVLSNAARHDEQEKHESGRLYYNILVIFTAGEISDFKETQLALSRASTSPVSVLIIGIGKQNFKKMRKLETGTDANTRNVMTFVDFNSVSNNIEKLEKEIMKKIPNQLVSYFWEKGKFPHNF